MVVNQLQAALQVMIERGYRYDPVTGVFYGLTGKPLKLTKTATQRYPTIAVATPALKRKTHAIPAHRAAGYYLWGDAIFNDNLQVRHLNGLFDLRACSLTLGTRIENMSDIPPDIRSKAAKIGRAAQIDKKGKSVFSQSQITFVKKTIRRDSKGKPLAGEVDRIAARMGVTASDISEMLQN